MVKLLHANKLPCLGKEPKWTRMLAFLCTASGIGHGKIFVLLLAHMLFFLFGLLGIKLKQSGFV